MLGKNCHSILYVFCRYLYTNYVNYSNKDGRYFKVGQLVSLRSSTFRPEDNGMATKEDPSSKQLRIQVRLGLRLRQKNDQK
jgi:hypothetical protein